MREHVASCRACHTEQPVKCAPAYCETCGALLVHTTKTITDNGVAVWSELFPTSAPPYQPKARTRDDRASTTWE